MISELAGPGIKIFLSEILPHVQLDKLFRIWLLSTLGLEV